MAEEYEFLLWIEENSKPIVIGEFKFLTIQIRDNTTKDLLDKDVQIAYILGNGIINQCLWGQYQQGIMQRSRRFNITFSSKCGREELVRCCCDVPKFIETNKVEIGLVEKVEGVAERFLQYSETIKEFKKRANYAYPRS